MLPWRPGHSSHQADHLHLPCGVPLSLPELSTLQHSFGQPLRTPVLGGVGRASTAPDLWSSRWTLSESPAGQGAGLPPPSALPWLGDLWALTLVTAGRAPLQRHCSLLQAVDNLTS